MCIFGAGFGGLGAGFGGLGAGFRGLGAGVCRATLAFGFLMVEQVFARVDIARPEPARPEPKFETKHGTCVAAVSLRRDWFIGASTAQPPGDDGLRSSAAWIHGPVFVYAEGCVERRLVVNVLI